MAMIGKVGRVYPRADAACEIVRLTSLSRNTVRKWMKAAVLEGPMYRHSKMLGEQIPFHNSLFLSAQG